VASLTSVKQEQAKAKLEQVGFGKPKTGMQKMKWKVKTALKGLNPDLSRQDGAKRGRLPIFPSVFFLYQITETLRAKAVNLTNPVQSAECTSISMI